MAKMYENLLILVGILSCFMVMGYVNAFTHIVGGNNGWRVPPNVTYFEEWVKPRTFGVGDKLVFPYRAGANNLVAVTKDGYEKCDQDNAIFMYFLGPTIVNLTKPGDYFYFCGIGKHCESGQKLFIHVDSKEGSSGSDPLPFDLNSITIDQTSSAETSVVSSPVAPPNKLNMHASSSSPNVISVEKLGAGVLFTLVLSMFI